MRMRRTYSLVAQTGFEPVSPVYETGILDRTRRPRVVRRFLEFDREFCSGITNNPIIITLCSIFILTTVTVVTDRNPNQRTGSDYGLYRTYEQVPQHL